MTDHMTRRLGGLTLAALMTAGLHAATINTTLTVNATGAVAGTSFTANGTATLTNIGSGTFSGTVSLTPDSSGNFSAPFTITLSGSASGTILGTLKIPPAILTGASTTGSATISGGTYGGGVTGGNFPSLTGSGSIGASGLSLTFTGGGTVITGGSGGGGGGGGTSPTITAVQDAGSYTSSIAQGSIFVVKGTNLSASGFSQMSFPLPTTSGNVKITFTPLTGGAGTDVYLVYLFNQNKVNQLAAVLPSTVNPGSYNVTVTYNTTASAPFPVTVVQRKLGLITADSTGSGLAVIQNYISASQLDIARFSTFSSGGYTFSPSKPGQVLIAWATGMGPVTGGDNVASPGFDFSANGVDVQVIVGGVSIKPFYAGRAPGLAGADQVNFQLPGNIPTGCVIPFQISVGGKLSNPSFIAIAPDANSSICVQPGYTSSDLQAFDGGATKTFGTFSMTQFSIAVPQIGTAKTDSTQGGFTRYTGFQLANLAQAQAQFNTTGGCVVSHIVSSSQSGLTPTVPGGLDAGAVTLTGPAGSGLSSQAYTQDPNSLQYSISLGTEGLPVGGSNFKLLAGQYTVTGAGGADVGKFSAQITLGAPLTLTGGGLPASINRTNGFTLNWTGGNASDLVVVFGGSSTTTGTGSSAITDSWSFTCTTTAGAGTINVPSSVTGQLPATTSGFLSLGSSVQPTSFSAPLTAGGSIDAGYFLSLSGYGSQVAFQ